MHARLSRLFATRIDTQSDKHRLEFEPGQVWQIGSGDHAGVELLVVKIEYDDLHGGIVHVTVRGPLFTRSGFELEGIPHLPFLDEALQQSDLYLAGHVEAVPDDWRDMYRDWVSDAEAGDAGLFSIPAGDILNDIMAHLPL